MDRRSRASKIIDLVDLNIERERYVVPHQFEAWMLHEMRDIRICAGEEIVDAQHVVSGGKQTLAKVRAKETRAAGNEELFHVGSLLGWAWQIAWFNGLSAFNATFGIRTDRSLISEGSRH